MCMWSKKPEEFSFGIKHEPWWLCATREWVLMKTQRALDAGKSYALVQGSCIPVIMLLSLVFPLCLVDYLKLFCCMYFTCADFTIAYVFCMPNISLVHFCISQRKLGWYFLRRTEGFTEYPRLGQCLISAHPALNHRLRHTVAPFLQT